MNDTQTSDNVYPASESSLAGVEPARVEYDSMGLHDIPIGQRRRGISRFEKRLQEKRRRSLASTQPSGRSANQLSAGNDKVVWGLVGFGIVLCVLLEILK